MRSGRCNRVHTRGDRRTRYRFHLIKWILWKTSYAENMHCTGQPCMQLVPSRELFALGPFPLRVICFAVCGWRHATTATAATVDFIQLRSNTVSTIKLPHIEWSVINNQCRRQTWIVWKMSKSPYIPAHLHIAANVTSIGIIRRHSRCHLPMVKCSIMSKWISRSSSNYIRMQPLRYRSHIAQ